MRKTRWILGVLCVVFCMALLMMPAKAEAASAKSKALKAYRQFLLQSSIPWAYDTATLSECEFALAYIDNDSIPELIILNNSACHASGYCWLYTYKDGEVFFVNNLMDDFAYYKKKGMYCSMHLGNGGYETWYYQFSEGEIKCKLYTQDERGWDVNGDGKIKINYEKIKKNSAWKTITKAAFKKQLKKLVGSRKQTTPTYYKNTAANRKRYLK